MTFPSVNVSELFAATHDVIRIVGRGVTEDYLARDRARDRAVLIRILHVADENTYRRFLRNAPLLERVRHPGVQLFVEAGRKGDAVYYVVDFVEGESLWQRMRREPSRALAVPLALDVAQQICAALGAAHDAQIAHGDLSPDRVLMHDGRAVITDLGVLRTFAQPPEQDIESDGPVLGNPAWLAPEQLTSAVVTACTDVHALGALLYFMLTGETPFAGDSALAVIRAILMGARPGYKGNPAIDAVIQRAMAVDPKARYQTMRELAAALREATPA